jgi:hypothetical protein
MGVSFQAPRPERALRMRPLSLSLYPFPATRPQRFLHQLFPPNETGVTITASLLLLLFLSEHLAHRFAQRSHTGWRSQKQKRLKTPSCMAVCVHSVARL